MKLISIIISLFFASTIVINSDHTKTKKDRGEVTKQVRYDGYDGRLFYFTDIKDNMIIIEDLKASNVLDAYNLDINLHVGDAFNLKLNNTTEDNIYSEIEVISINILNQ
ncbi:hypothetical protein [Olleya namhaensis]|uniref:hypothetical protein n=1 Tax=Olleya namhaensis TaxID=1144750 RepID=UPI0024936992|nr:hypothetical protein [Olleya namhaensis]